MAAGHRALGQDRPCTASRQKVRPLPVTLQQAELHAGCHDYEAAANTWEARRVVLGSNDRRRRELEGARLQTARLQRVQLPGAKGGRTRRRHRRHRGQEAPDRRQRGLSFPSLAPVLGAQRHEQAAPKKQGQLAPPPVQVGRRHNSA